MTYLPDSVLVEKVAEALCEEDGQKWEHVKTDPWEHGFWLRLGECALRVACPLVAGVIADRLDELFAETGASEAVDHITRLVRREFGEGA